MSVSLFFARRYLFSKKSKNAINYITTVSVILITLVTIAMIITMSVFNGLSDVITSMFNTFDPEIKITAKTGRVFSLDSVENKLQQTSGIQAYTPILEDDALFTYGDKQLIGKLKGVGESYTKTCNVDSILVAGEFVLEQNDVHYACVGQGVAHKLSVGLMFRDVLHIYAPERSKRSSFVPTEEYNKTYAYARGVFSVQMDIDNEYIITSLALAQELWKYTNNEVSSIELKVTDNTDIHSVVKNLQQTLGDDFSIKDRETQHEFMYKVTQGEKFVTFLIITLILIIASFSIIGSLSMLIIDKQRDIAVLRSMGANSQTIKRIFILEGWLIAVLGAFIGVVLGVAICGIQEYFGIVKLPGASANFIVQAYPVKVLFTDVISILFVVLLVGFVTAYYPVRKISKSQQQ
ncbi:MAG: FtsX-like permease family protein [Bacteroidales bacterium]|nr:FtsX-like permease family protein [Bacteroidales bacterium]